MKRIVCLVAVVMMVGLLALPMASMAADIPMPSSMPSVTTVLGEVTSAAPHILQIGWNISALALSTPQGIIALTITLLMAAIAIIFMIIGNVRLNATAGKGGGYRRRKP